MSTVTLLHCPPCAELLASLSRVIRLGVPPAIPSPAWTDEKAGAPAGHWLLPTGARVYTYEEKEPVKSPCVMLSIPTDAGQRYASSRAYWDVPIQIDVMFNRVLKISRVDRMAMVLTRLLIEELPTGNPATEKPWDRLTDDYVQVFPHAFRDVKSTPLRQENNHPVIRLTGTVFCGTKALLPATA